MSIYFDPQSSKKDNDLILAALWCIINLTWSDDRGSKNRIEQLRSTGFLAPIEALSTFGNADIKDRAQTALKHFTQDMQQDWGVWKATLKSSLRD